MTKEMQDVAKQLNNANFREKYGMLPTIEENYDFIASNPRDQKGKDSIMWIAHYMETLRKYASECKHVIEFGVNQVNSTYALLAARPKKVVSVDIDLHVKPTKNVPEFRKVNLWLIWAMHLCAEEKVNFVAIQADSVKLDIEPTELLFIDSLHTKAHLRAELTKHKDLVSKYIIFHDTTLFSKQLMPPIQELLDEGDFEVAEHLKDKPGLMVIKRKGI